MLFSKSMLKRQPATTQCRQAPASRLRASARVPSADAARGSTSQLSVVFQDRAFLVLQVSEPKQFNRSSRVLMFGVFETFGLHER
jgi:hypothetical protein